jgi:hypothetical protein
MSSTEMRAQVGPIRYNHRAMQVFPPPSPFSSKSSGPEKASCDRDGSFAVNPAQFYRICQRRSERTTRELRRPNEPHRKYLHESRHRHAVNRVRGNQGRFSNADNCQPTCDADHLSSAPKSANCCTDDATSFTSSTSFNSNSSFTSSSSYTYTCPQDSQGSPIPSVFALTGVPSTTPSVFALADVSTSLSASPSFGTLAKDPRLEEEEAISLDFLLDALGTQQPNAEQVQ